MEVGEAVIYELGGCRLSFVELCPEGAVLESMVHGQYLSNEEKGIVEEEMVLISKQGLIHLLRERKKHPLPTGGTGKSTPPLRDV